MGIGLEVKSLNISLVLLFDSSCWIKLIVEFGMHLFLRLWISLFVAALGNAPSMSRKGLRQIYYYSTLCVFFGLDIELHLMLSAWVVH